MAIAGIWSNNLNLSNRNLKWTQHYVWIVLQSSTTISNCNLPVATGFDKAGHRPCQQVANIWLYKNCIITYIWVKALSTLKLTYLSWNLQVIFFISHRILQHKYVIHILIEISEASIYLAVPGKRRSTSCSPTENALKVFPLMWGPGWVLTKLGSWVTSRSPFGGINSSFWEIAPVTCQQYIFIKWRKMCTSIILPSSQVLTDCWFSSF